MCLLAACYVADKTLEVLRKHGLEHKTAAYVTDTCSVMKAAWALLNKELPLLLCFGCQAHVWSLFLKDICSLPEVSTAPRALASAWVASVFVQSTQAAKAMH